MARERSLRPVQRKPHIKEPLLQAFLPDRVKQFIYGTPHFALLSGNAGMYIANNVGDILGKEVPANPPAFSNHETRILVPRDLATKDVYVIQSTDGNPDSALTQLRLLEEGAKGVGANRITAIVTHLPYSRQDRREQPGAPEAARLFAREIIRAGSHDPEKRRHESDLRAKANLILVDVHSEKPLYPLTKSNHIQWANLDSTYVLAPRMQEVISQNDLDPVVAFPDKGAATRYENYADMFGNGIASAAVIKKERDMTKNNTVTISATQEDLTDKVSGKDAFLIDDIIDTGGTLLQAAKLLKQQGARSVRIVATHGIFSNDALTKLSDDAIDGIIITDTIAPRPEVSAHPKIEVIGIAPLIAEAIKRIEARQPIADLVKSMSPGFELSYRRLKMRENYYRRHHPKN